jgi:hypothetical protein
MLEFDQDYFVRARARAERRVSIKLDRSQTSGPYFTQGITSSSRQGLSGLIIFDVTSDRSVGPQGYFIIETASRGQVVRVGDYMARYIGAGG